MYLSYYCAYFQSNIAIGEESLHFECFTYPPLQNNDETFSAQDNAMPFEMTLWQIIVTISLPFMTRINSKNLKFNLNSSS